MIGIRAASPDDFNRISEIVCLISPERPQSAEEMLEESANHDSKIREQYFVALLERSEAQGSTLLERSEAQGSTLLEQQIQGYLMFTQHQDHYHPRHFWLRAGVHPDFRRQGIGSKLLKRAMQELEPFKPELLQVGVREDRDYSIRFLEHHGFTEEWRRLSFVLKLEDFDETPFAGLIEKLEAQGFMFKTTDQLRDDPARDQKLCDLCNTVGDDVPLGLVNTPLNLAQFRKSILEISWAREQAFVVAIYDGQYVGVNNLGVDANGNSFVDITGVLPAFRGRGLASALKLLGIQWARSQGIREMFTNNDAINLPMVAVNEKFGFTRRPSQIRFGKKLLGAS